MKTCLFPRQNGLSIHHTLSCWRDSGGHMLPEVHEDAAIQLLQVCWDVKRCIRCSSCADVVCHSYLRCWVVTDEFQCLVGWTSTSLALYPHLKSTTLTKPPFSVFFNIFWRHIELLNTVKQVANSLLKPPVQLLLILVSHWCLLGKFRRNM